MAIVAVLCGGNGIGILAAGLHWKANGNLPVAIGIAVGVTALALAAVAIIVLVHKKRTKERSWSSEKRNGSICCIEI